MSRTPVAESLPHRRFLEGLLRLAAGKTDRHFKLLPSARDFLVADSGVAGVSFRYVVGREKSRVELYIARSDASANERLFDGLRAHERAIGEEFKGRLEWQPLEQSVSCRVAREIRGGVSDDESKWPLLQAELVDAMARLEEALSPFINKLRDAP